MTDELAGAERELRRAREALAHTEHGADDSMAQIRYVRALTARNKARVRGRELEAGGGQAGEVAGDDE